jgi:hypothetical protein
VQDPNAPGQRLGFGKVVRAQQDRRIALRAQLLDERLHLALGARVKPGRRFVEQQL